MSATIESTETIDSATKAAPVLIFGLTSSAWDKALIASLIIAAIAAVAVGFSTAASIIAHQQETIEADAGLERYKTVAAGKIAEAHTAGIEAGRSASDAIARAAEANAEAKKAQLALETYRAPRRIEPDYAQAMISIMMPFSGSRVTVGASPETVESSALAEQIGDILKQAGLDVDVRSRTAQAQLGLARGVVVGFTTGNDHGSKLATAISEQLNRSGVAATPWGGLANDVLSSPANAGLDRNSDHFKWVIIAVGDKI